MVCFVDILNETLKIDMNVHNVFTSKEYERFDKKIRNIEKLQCIGLSEDEIKLYFNYQQGMEYLQSLHKNIERKALIKRIDSVMKKINARKPSNSSENVNYAIDPTLQMNKVRNLNKVPASHPINHLNELENDLFGHMDVGTMPPLNKRRKLLRRMDRRSKKQIELPEPIKTDHNQTSSNNPCTLGSPYLNDFIKCAPQNQSGSSHKPNSMWDMKHVPMQEKPNTPNVENTKQVIGCKERTLYTIRNKTIVRLERIPSEDNIQSCNVRNIITPTNKAEEWLLEGTKLSLEEIKALPRFENYQLGSISNVLYLKNLSKHVTEEDLSKLFERNAPSKISLLKGRMREQAFVTFLDDESAMKALNQTNGTIIQGKAIIMQYGKHKEYT